MSERTLLLSAHPDDIEVMLGNQAMAAHDANQQVYALVATTGEASSLKYSQDRWLCRRR